MIYDLNNNKYPNPASIILKAMIGFKLIANADSLTVGHYSMLTDIKNNTEDFKIVYII